jgi:hypothetical protein
MIGALWKILTDLLICLGNLLLLYLGCSSGSSGTATGIPSYDPV